jgi:hypothetical protein
MEEVYERYFQAAQPETVRTVLSEENLRFFQRAYADTARRRYPSSQAPIRVPERERRDVAEAALPSSAFGIASRRRGYGTFVIADLGNDVLVTFRGIGDAYVPSSLVVISRRST